MAFDLGFDGAADQAGAAAQDGDRMVRRGIVGIEQSFFRGAALLPERQELLRVQLGVLGGQILFHLAGQGEVHVVAAEQDVLADGNAFEREFAARILNIDQREVGRTAADVHDEDAISRAHLLPPFGMLGQPGVERGLGLFEQNQVFDACIAGCLFGELARDSIKARRNREDDTRMGQIDAGCLRKVLQICLGGIDWGEPLDAFGGAERQKLTMPIHSGIAEPGLGARYKPALGFRAALASVAADQPAIVLRGGGR